MEKTAQDKANEYIGKFRGNKEDAKELVLFHIDYIQNLPYKKSKRFDRKNRVTFWQSVLTEINKYHHQ